MYTLTKDDIDTVLSLIDDWQMFDDTENLTDQQVIDILNLQKILEAIKVANSKSSA